MNKNMTELVPGVYHAAGAAAVGLWKSRCQDSWSVPIAVKEPHDHS